MLLAFLSIAFAAYVGIAQVNQYRLSEYLDQVAKGTFTLIAEGLARHEGVKQLQWLEAVKRLTQLDLSIKSLAALPLSSGETSQLLNQHFLIKANHKEELALIYVKVPNQSHLYLSGKLKDINEPLSRVTALLILNELGRNPKETRLQVLKQLQSRFGFPIAKVDIYQSGLRGSQINRIKKGDTVVLLESTVSDQPKIFVYAPYGNSGDLLTLGPIPLFNWYPKNLLALLGLLAISLAAAMSYLCVKPLEGRLKKMTEQVSSLGLRGQFSKIDVKGSDAISDFARQVNQMSLQIHSLLENQRELTLAVSHDLKTPVARLKFRMAELEELLSDYMDPIGLPDCEQTVNGIYRDIKQLESLLQEILSYASLDRINNNMEQSPFDLGVETQTLASELSLTYPTLTITQPVAPFTAFGNPQLIRRAIENLLSNACRYASGTIEICLKQTSNLYIVTIIDDGPGIAEQQAQKIFEPFYRIDSSRNSKSGGSGLGLAIVEKIAHLHHGQARLLKSSHGATFEICWPKP